MKKARRNRYGGPRHEMCKFWTTALVVG